MQPHACKVYRDADSEEHHQWRGTVCPVGMEKKVLALNDEEKKSIAEGRSLKLAQFYERPKFRAMRIS